MDGCHGDWKTIPTLNRYSDSISYPTILTWTPTPPLRTSKGQDLFLHLLLKPRAQLPLREGSLCCKLKQNVHFFRGHCLWFIFFCCFLFWFCFVLSWSNFKRKYYNKNVNQKVTLSVIVRQTRLFTSSFAFKSVILFCGIHEKQGGDFIWNCF